MEVSSDAVLSEAEVASQPFLGRWHTLVSTTNWEKGRIICDWREALVDAGRPAAEYSDEAWANRAGGVTSQHVGRLRRVHDRFAASHASYEGLYWSHFQAALDWEDAEMWLEGALQNDWSVGRMRQERVATLGDVEARGDELAAQVDDRAAAEQAAAEESAGDGADHDDRISPSVARLQASDLATSDEVDDATDAAYDDAEDDSDDDATRSARRDPPVRPFAELPELPDDLQAAFDAFKLAILNHRREGWQDVSCDDVVATLDALKMLAVAPLDD